MADLGGIEFVNPNTGTQPGQDRRAELQHLAAGLGTGKAIAEGVILKNVQDKMVGAMDEALAASTSSVSTTTDPGMDALSQQEPYAPSERERYLVSRMDRLNTVMQQGTVSQRTLAEMEIQNIMVQATNRFPWLREEIQRRAGATLNGAWQMSKLGIHDEVRREAADAASAQYKMLLDDAYKPVQNNGLGIPTSLHPDDPEFIRLFTKNSQDRFFRQQYELKRQVLEAKDGLAFMEALPEMDKFLTTATGGAAVEWTKFKAVTGIETALKLDSAGKLPPVEAENLKRMAPGFISQLDQMKSNLQSAWSGAYMLPRFLSNPEAKARQEQFDGVMAMYDSMKVTLKDVIDGTPGAAQRLQVQMDVINHSMFNKLDPTGQERVAYFNGPGEKIMPIVTATLGASPLLATNMLGGMLTEDLKTMLTSASNGHAGQLAVLDFNSTGTVNVPPGAAAGDILQAVRARHLDDNATWVYPASPRDAAIAAFTNIEAHEKLWEAATNVVEGASPQYADKTLLGTIYSLEFLNSSTTRPSNLMPKVLDVVSSANIQNALNSASPEMRKAFAQSLEQFYQNTNPKAVRGVKAADMVNTYPSSGPNNLYELVKVSSQKLLENEFHWYIDEAALAEQVNAIMANGTSSYRNKSRIEEEIKEQIFEEMDKIKAVMKQQLDTQATIQMGKGDPLQFSELFLGAGSSSAGTWASLFRIDNDRMGL